MVQNWDKEMALRPREDVLLRNQGSGGQFQQKIRKAGESSHSSIDTHKQRTQMSPGKVLNTGGLHKYQASFWYTSNVAYELLKDFIIEKSRRRWVLRMTDLDPIGTGKRVL